MTRVAALVFEDLDTGRKDIYKAISGQRGGVVDGPFRAWLRANPELASRINDVAGVLRTNGKLDKRLFEVAVLCVARFWKSDYQWSAHGPLALQAGLTPDVIEAIGGGHSPSFARGEEQLTYDFTMALLTDRAVPQTLYDQVLELLGFEQMVELVTTVGWYGMAATVLNGFAIEPLAGGPQLPH